VHSGPTCIKNTPTMQDALPVLEKKGRSFIARLFSFLGSVKHTSHLPPHFSKILIVRIDERLGNILLLTPLLASLKQSFPHTHITVLAHEKASALLKNHPHVDRFLPFNKRALWGSESLLFRWFYLKRQKYDIAIDASNPTCPSLTHALLVWKSNAHYTLGSALSSCASLFHAASPMQAHTHEIDLRLALLEPLHPAHLIRTMHIRPTQAPSPVKKPYAVLNMGARLPEKQLSISTYTAIASCMQKHGCPVYLTYGPHEKNLAQSIHQNVPQSHMAPETNIHTLQTFFEHARYVVSCDTGPMHLATATGTPTCGLFVSTSKERYGHTYAPHAALEMCNQPLEDVLKLLSEWIEATLQTPSNR
jgi:heptosyltransferase-3